MPEIGIRPKKKKDIKSSSAADGATLRIIANHLRQKQRNKKFFTFYCCYCVKFNFIYQRGFPFGFS